MIFGLFGCPAMGIRGAAIATVIGQMVGAIAALLFNRFRNPLIHVHLKNYHFRWRDVADIYLVGLPTNSHLEYAGCSQTIFTEKALDEIYRISTGIPRMINRVCEKALMYAFHKQNRLIDDYMVKYVAEHELING